MLNSELIKSSTRRLIASQPEPPANIFLIGTQSQPKFNRYFGFRRLFCLIIAAGIDCGLCPILNGIVERLCHKMNYTIQPEEDVPVYLHRVNSLIQ